MIDTGAVAVVSLGVLLWVLASARLQRWGVTPAIAFVVLGFVLAGGPIRFSVLDLDTELVKGTAELTLAVVLFTDASGVTLGQLRREEGRASRLLLIGLPLTIVAGWLAARLLFPGLDGWACAVLAAAVAPTDAALGAPLMADERLPARLRRVLNVESGLNDGLATPLVNFFIAGAVAAAGLASSWEGGVVKAIVVGAAAGAALGAAGGLALRWGRSRGWTSEQAPQLGVLALALLAYSASLQLEGNGFVAAFVAGLAFAAVPVPPVEREDELPFAETAGTLLSGVVWFMFGASILPVLADATWRDVVFAVLALTVVRMAPVALASIGSGVDRTTVALVGWFGPRGLATLVFAILALNEVPEPWGRTIAVAATVTVLMSVVAHGVSASPLARWYAQTHQGSA